MINPPHTHTVRQRSPTSRLGNPCGSILLRPKQTFLTLTEQRQRRAAKKTQAGIFFDRTRVHTDHKVCHRIYRPLTARISTAASRTYGPTSPRNHQRAMRQQRNNASQPRGSRRSRRPRPLQQQTTSSPTSLELKSELYLDAGGSVSSNAGWVTRYPATYRAVTIQAGQMPTTRPLTLHQGGRYPSELSISNYETSTIPPATTSPATAAPAVQDSSLSLQPSSLSLPRSPTPPLYGPPTHGIIASIDWNRKHQPVSRYNRHYVCSIIRAESCITGELSLFYSCRGNCELGPLPCAEESVLIDPNGVEHSVLWHEELLCETNNSKYQLVEGVLTFPFIFMEHNDDQILRIENVIHGLPSMTSFVYGGRPLARPGWWSEAALRPLPASAISPKQHERFNRMTASGIARQKPKLWKKQRNVVSDRHSPLIDPEIRIRARQRSLRANSRGISMLRPASVMAATTRARARPARPSTSAARRVGPYRIGGTRPSNFVHVGVARRVRPATYQPIGVRFPPKRQPLQRPRRRNFRLTSGKPASGLAGICAMLPPDVTPCLSRSKGIEKEYEVEIIQGEREDQSDERETTVISANRNQERSITWYAQGLVTSALEHATRAVILPLLERPLVQVVNITLEKELEEQKEVVVVVHRRIPAKVSKVTETKNSNKSTPVKEEEHVESIVYLDKWVKTAVEDELRRKEIIKHHMNQDDGEKMELLAKLYSKDREYALNRLTKALPATLDEMWDVVV